MKQRGNVCNLISSQPLFHWLHARGSGVLHYYYNTISLATDMLEVLKSTYLTQLLVVKAQPCYNDVMNCCLDFNKTASLLLLTHIQEILRQSDTFHNFPLEYRERFYGILLLSEGWEFHLVRFLFLPKVCKVLANLVL